MIIEEEIFKKSEVDFNKAKKYGFKIKNNYYIYSKNIINDTFRVDIKIENNGMVSGKVIDLFSEDEYTNFRIEDSIGSFVGKVRNEFEKILKDVRDNCFIRKLFAFEQSNRIANLIFEKYGDEPEFPWEKSQEDAIFRNPDSKKWYGLIMNIDKSKLKKDLNGEIEVINIKLEPKEIINLLKKDGFYPAYHMNKKSWITIILDNTLSDEEIMNLIDKSYSFTIKNKKFP